MSLPPTWFTRGSATTYSWNLTKDPGNDWGPDWSPDGRTIVFNSDRDGLPMGGFLVHPDGSNLHRIAGDSYVEYPAWSPDAKRIAFMGGDSAAEYDIWVVDVDGSNLVRITESPGPDGWPAWSPDGTRIAFTSVQDDCSYSDAPDCRTTGDIRPHHDVWVVNADGIRLGRVTPEFGQFVTWSPDGEYLLVSGYDLYVIRPDGTGRASLDIAGLSACSRTGSSRLLRACEGQSGSIGRTRFSRGCAAPRGESGS